MNRRVRVKERPHTEDVFGKRLVLEPDIQFVVAGDAPLARRDARTHALAPATPDALAVAPEKLRAAIEPLRGYEWCSAENAEEAAGHFWAAAHAEYNGLRKQRDKHLRRMRRVWRLDQVERSVELLRERGVASKLFLIRSSPGQDAFVIPGEDDEWLMTPVVQSDRELPAKALEALTIARDSGLPIDGVWVGTPNQPSLAEVARHDMRRATRAVKRTVAEYWREIVGVAGAATAGALVA